MLRSLILSSTHNGYHPKKMPESSKAEGRLMMERIEEEVKKDWRQERLEVTTPQLTSVVHLNESTVAYADSTELLGRSLHAAEWSLGPSHDMTILAASDLASVLMQTDSVEAHDQAEHLLRRCVRHWRQKDSEEGSLPSLRTVAAVRALATMTTTLKRPGMLDCARTTPSRVLRDHPNEVSAHLRP